jgi:heat shock protein HslJ
MKILSRILPAIILWVLMLTSLQAQTLAGEWKLVEARQNGRRVSFSGEIRTTLKFGEENRIGGNAGCNRYSSTYTLGGRNRIKLGPAISTKMACLDQDFMKQERTFFGVLEKIGKFRIKENHLILSDAAQKNVLRFARASK